MMRATLRTAFLVLMVVLVAALVAVVLAGMAPLRDALADAPRVHIRASCLAAEDTAAHLKLLSYGEGTIRYGCYHTGY